MITSELQMILDSSKAIKLHSECVLTVREIQTTGFVLLQFLNSGTRQAAEKTLVDQFSHVNRIFVKGSIKANALLGEDVVLGNIVEFSNYDTSNLIVNLDDPFDLDNVIRGLEQDKKTDKNLESNIRSLKFKVRMYSISQASFIIATTNFKNKPLEITEEKKSIIIQ